MQGILKNSIRLIPWRMRQSIRRVPVVAWIQRKLISWMLEGREFVHQVDAGPARGLRYPVILPDDKGVWTGTYELDFFQRLAADVKPGMVCLDIGGWRGYGAGVMASCGASTVYIFEPLPANCERIQKMIDLNPDLPIHLQQVAVGETDGTATFHLMPETSMGKLDSSTFQKTITGTNQIQVKVCSLDSWYKSNPSKRIGVIKLDIEGAELMALRGAIKLLEKERPHLFVEAHSRELAQGVTELLVAHGYTVSTLETGNPPDGSSEPDVCHLRAIPVNSPATAH